VRRETYKGISNRVLLFGYNPSDLPPLLIGFVVVQGIFGSTLLDLLYLAAGLYLARKVRTRPDDVLVTLYLYATTPTELPLPELPETRTPS
jgi:hypothetical protein